MKKNFLVLIVLLVSLTTSNMAQTNYGLKIAGVSINASNAADILKKTGKGSGKMSYDAASHTLTLENVILDSGNDNSIESESSLSDLTIILKGENLITQKKGRINLGSVKNKITGSGSLKATSLSNAGIYLDESELLITGDCTLELKGAWGICGYAGLTETLIIEGATVKATGTSGSICDIKELFLRDCIITSPSGATIKGGTVVVDDNLCTSQVIIEKVAKEYDVTVNGIKVDEANASDILGDGKISYNAIYKTLTLENATITANNQPAIETKSDIIIELKGINKLSSDNDVLIFENNTLIRGNGSIELISKNNAALKAHKNIIIDRVENFTANGKYGIMGIKSGNTNKLLLKHTSANAIGIEGSIVGFSFIDFEGCHIFEPHGATVSNGEVVLDNVVCTQKVVINKTIEYPLFLCGKLVTSENCKDVFNDGCASYDAENRVLTLNNFNYVTQEASSGINALSSLDNFTIILKGNNSISSPYYGIVFSCNTNIKGDGNLNVTSTGSTGIIVNGVTLTIENSNITVNGEIGISGFFEDSGSLILKNALLKAQGANGSIINFIKLQLDGCQIKQPVGAVFNNSTKQVELNGKAVTEQIVIEPNNTNISTSLIDMGIDIKGQKGMLHINVDKHYDKNTTINVYNISGEIVKSITHLYSTQISIILPTGIYIVKANNITEKVMVR